MRTLNVVIGPYAFRARLEEQLAPETCRAFLAWLPFRGKLMQARWSGEAGWVPLGDQSLGVGYENHTSYPAPGQVLWHPAGLSEAEILVPYGPTRFASKVGQLAGNHFLTLIDNPEHLRRLGHDLVWRGAQDITISLDA